MDSKPEARMAFLLLYWTGMRIGELLALTYEDIDLEKRCVQKLQRRKCKVAKTKDIALLRSWKGDRMKQIQIPEQLFMELVKFHLLDMEENLPNIKQGLEAKVDAMVIRDLYSKYKTAPTEEEREQARKEYLDRRGVLEKFRW